MRQNLLEFWEGVLIALRAIRVNKLRALLTTLGIIIGIVSVTLMATVVNGLEQGFENDMAELGTDVLYIEKWPWVGGPGFKWWNYINRPQMSADLADAVMAKSRYAVAAAPRVWESASVTNANGRLSNISIYGTTASYPEVHVTDIAEGYFFTEFDAQSARAVAVVGPTIIEELFPFEDPLGKSIRIGGQRYQVVGVFKKKGTSSEGSTSTDSQIFIPYNTFKQQFGLRWRDVSVQVRIQNAALTEEAKDEMTGILRVARRLDPLEENNFEINEQQTLREQIAPVKATIYSIGIGLTALSLLVGGIGVMNIMFVSVKERTREIGIRKAVGAKRRSILTQFLIEAVVVCMVGGLMGVLISLPLALVVRSFLPAFVDIGTIGVAFLICVLVGVVFGLAPAWSAARSEPIEALRYE